MVFFGIYWLSFLREVLGVDDEILTIRELAALLKIGEETAYTMPQSGELPGFKVRDQWRFRRADIDAWIAEKVQRKDNDRERKSREPVPYRAQAATAARSQSGELRSRRCTDDPGSRRVWAGVRPAQC